MLQLVQAIPDPNVLLALEPEELAAKLLFLIRQRGGLIHAGNFTNELFGIGATPGYSRERSDEIVLAFTEAWAWLEAQGLLVPAEATNGQNGWRVLSRRAKRMENEVDFANFKTARLLPRDLLHPTFAGTVWLAFMRGEFDVAALQAMKSVEVAVRKAAGFGNSMIGVTLMRAAFNPKDGPLSDMQSETGERVGRMELFAGAIGSYKNAQSHRDVNLEDPVEAMEIIMLANHLLRIVEARAASQR